MRRASILLMGGASIPPGGSNMNDILGKIHDREGPSGRHVGYDSTPLRTQPGDHFDIGVLRQKMGGMELPPDMMGQLNMMKDSVLQGHTSGGGPQMGMMAFGLGENERGKKVARAAKMTVDGSGKVQKDFVEKQLDPDDPELPRHEAPKYDGEEIEVEFVKGNISEGDIEVEFVDESSKKK